MNVNMRYVKDESGNIFSPITSAKSVFFDDNTDLSNTCTLNLLFSGILNFSETTEVNCSVVDDINNYNWICIKRAGNVSQWTYINTDDMNYRLCNIDCSDYNTEAVNIFYTYMRRVSSTVVAFKYNRAILLGIQANVSYNTQTKQPVTAIYGIKLKNEIL